MSRSITIYLFLLVWPALQAQSFPQSWEGLWTGHLEVWKAEKKIAQVPMSLEIQPQDESWTFIITYQAGTDQPDQRRYSLITVDAAAGHYAIDEHNSIVLDAYLIGNCLYDRFAVAGSDLFSRICLRGDELEYEITSGRSEPVRISGDTVLEGDTIPPVSSFAIINVTKAVLRRSP